MQSNVMAPDQHDAQTRSDPAELRFQHEASRHLSEILRQTGGRRVPYISTPITTGQRLLEWRARQGEAERPSASEAQLKAEVVRANIEALKPLRDKIRRYVSDTFVDPTELHAEGWSQEQYHRFWVTVIERTISSVYFADGWHLSTGCSIEFGAARALKLPVFNSALEPLEPATAVRLLKWGAATVAKAGMNPDPMLRAVQIDDCADIAERQSKNEGPSA